MAKKPETGLQVKIQKAIRREFKNSWVFKVWGGPFTPAGIPDLIACVDGLFFALEVKLPDERRSKTSAIQDETIDEIRRAGGASCVVRSVDETITFIYRTLREFYGDRAYPVARAIRRR